MPGNQPAGGAPGGPDLDRIAEHGDAHTALHLAYAEPGAERQDIALGRPDQQGPRRRGGVGAGGDQDLAAAQVDAPGRLGEGDVGGAVGVQHQFGGIGQGHRLALAHGGRHIRAPFVPGLLPGQGPGGACRGKPRHQHQGPAPVGLRIALAQHLPAKPGGQAFDLPCRPASPAETAVSRPSISTSPQRPGDA
nr:hypothetical protein [Paracoccus mutanolyticus]